ncbi:response regulator [Paraglaciecola hydrolytica]|uniref:Two-component system response regulator n=1 Tax=Paraglaciecola hydrolytica TaxID=1799789 RepID=A0A148KM38_9ALTE|nr:response regulator [Paraglaciecola hydrolytica]KXI27341.1 two-component system response regulator [Paraglaciecola hydrolytica]
MTHVLIVDDNPDIIVSLKRYLLDHGFRVSSANGGKNMRSLLETSAIDIILLDIMMPDEDGLTLCRYVQDKYKIPVILLTALSEDSDKVVGLEMGADDYITKPFNPRVLLARLKAVLRRSQSEPVQINQVTKERSTSKFDCWTLDLNQRELVGHDNMSIALSAAEFRLLQAFILRPQKVLTRDQLLDLTHGREAKAFDRSIDNLISRLRRKVEVDASEPKIIKTVWGGGYILTSPVEHH